MSQIATVRFSSSPQHAFIRQYKKSRCDEVYFLAHANIAGFAQSLEHVLQNINKLNRSLEGVIAVCLSLFLFVCFYFVSFTSLVMHWESTS